MNTNDYCLVKANHNFLVFTDGAKKPINVFSLRIFKKLTSYRAECFEIFSVLVP